MLRIAGQTAGPNEPKNFVDSNGWPRVGIGLKHTIIFVPPKFFFPRATPSACI